MGRKKAQPNYRRTVLRLPDLDHSKLVVLNSLASPRCDQHCCKQTGSPDAHSHTPSSVIVTQLVRGRLQF
jgi:hypothetical protein